jgi:PmbA protein
MPKHHGFTCEPGELESLAQAVLDQARRAGASGCDCDVSESYGLSVTVRKGKPDTVEHNRDRSLGVSVYWGERPKARRGHASTSDFLARGGQPDGRGRGRHRAPHGRGRLRGLPDADMLARGAHDMDLFHPWAISTEEAIDLAKRCEAAAFAVSKKIRNSEGASVSAQHSQFVTANSLGFVGGYPGSRHWLSCSVIAEEKGLMQRDDWYSASRSPGQACRSGRARPLRRPADARSPGGAQDSHRQGAGAVRGAGGASAHRPLHLGGERRQSLSQDLVPGGEPRAEAVLAARRYRGAPARAGAMASAPFDEEGVATRDRTIVRAGVIEGYFLGTYSARKLGMKSTGNAGGHHNLFVRSEGPISPECCSICAKACSSRS